MATCAETNEQGSETALPSTARRIAVVTGAGAGIGEAIALALAGRGAALAVIDRDEHAASQVADAIERAGGRAIALCADLSDRQAPDRIADDVEQRLGAPDILVNNAGEGGGERFVDVTPERYDAVFAVSARASFFVTQRLVPSMQARRWGRIVNISSLVAVRGAPGNPHYAGAKAAMIGFTRCWAQELAPHGITVNVVPVALTDTAMVTAAHGAVFAAERARGVPAGRIGVANDVAETVAWLCSDAAAFVNGQAISPNGAEFTGAI